MHAGELMDLKAMSAICTDSEFSSSFHSSDKELAAESSERLSLMHELHQATSMLLPGDSETVFEALRDSTHVIGRF
jgi:hypothetical protein